MSRGDDFSTSEMLKLAAFAGLFAVVVYIGRGVFMENFAKALSFPQNNFFGNIALSTMEKYNTPGSK